MTEADDNKFMQRCIDLAVGAEGLTYPNPMVGSVIVGNGVVIGEGFHFKAGEAHAEVNAINSVKKRELLKSSTLYVNLEPCSHYGKTPPCADFIIANGIPEVVVGTIDSSEKVSGKGIEKLKSAGCDVREGVLEKECRQLNRRFFTFHENKRPFITLKWAQSSDGFIDVIRSAESMDGPHWITGKSERILVHKWRSTEQSILTGGRTVRTDLPRLDVREWSGPNPLKLILSSSGNIGSEAKNTDSQVILFTHDVIAGSDNMQKVVLSKDIPSATQICDYLYSKGIQSLFIEGGAEVLNHFISLGLWDEARIFTGDEKFRDGTRAPALKGDFLSRTLFSNSMLEMYLNSCDTEKGIDN